MAARNIEKSLIFYDIFVYCGHGKIVMSVFAGCNISHGRFKRENNNVQPIYGINLIK